MNGTVRRIARLAAPTDLQITVFAETTGNTTAVNTLLKAHF
jgi:hypothetical protein